jgi:hypothetical protein
MAGLMVCAAVLLMLAAGDRRAAPMTLPALERLLARGRAALERGDSGTVAALFTRDARIQDRTPAQLREALEQTVRELKGRSLTIHWSNLALKSVRDKAEAAFDFELAQHTARADITYLRGRMHLTLMKERDARWLGLFHEEHWRIKQLTATPGLDIPVP